MFPKTASDKKLYFISNIIYVNLANIHSIYILYS